MLHLSLFRFFALCLVLFGVIIQPTSRAGAATRQIGEPLDPFDRVFLYTFSPDGRWVVYNTLDYASRSFKLYSVSTSGQTKIVRQIEEPVKYYEISANSEWMVYSVGDVNGTDKLYATRLDGDEVIQLYPRLSPTQELVRQWDISADGRYVVYVESNDYDQEIIYRVPIDGTAPAKQLSGNIHQSINFDRPLFELTPDGSRVLFVGWKDNQQVDGLYSTRLDDGTAVRLSAPLVAGTSIGEYQVSANSQHVIFGIIQSSSTSRNMISLNETPVDRSSPVVLAIAPGPERIISTFEISPDSQQVVYKTRRNGEFKDMSFHQLYRVPITGGASIHMNVITRNKEGVFHFAISSDGTKVVYSSDVNTFGSSRLYSVPLLGGVQSLLVSHVNADEFIGSVSITPDDQQVVYSTYNGIKRQLTFYSASVYGGAISKLYVGARDKEEDFVITPDSERIMLRYEVSDEYQNNIVQIPLRGGGTMPIDTKTSEYNYKYELSPDGTKILYRAEGGLYLTDVTFNQVFLPLARRS